MGAPIEFKQPGTFTPIIDIATGGKFGMLAGEWTDDTYSSITKPLRSADFYKKLQSILDLGSTNSVASRGSDDYETIKLICREQIKRGINPDKDSLAFSVLSQVNNYTLAWGADVAYYSEGLGSCNLWIEQEQANNSIKNLIEDRGLKRKMYLSYKDEGDIKGYTREFGDGWYFYLQNRN